MGESGITVKSLTAISEVISLSLDFPQVQEITAISDITSDFQLDIYISELWLDPSLRYADMSPCTQVVIVQQIIGAIYIPHFIEGKQNLSLNNELLKQ